MQRFVVLVSLIALIGLGGATPVRAAASTTTVSIFKCHIAGGEALVPSGANVELTMGWASVELWEEVLFLLSVKTAATIDGVEVKHVNRYWGPLEYTPGLDAPWAVRWTYPAGTLEPGQTVTITYTWTFRIPVFDGVEWFPRGIWFEPMSCTITGAET